MTRYDYVFPSITDKIEERQLKQKSYFDNKKRCHTFDVGDTVYVKNFHEGKKWLDGTIVKRLGNVMYEVRLDQLQK